MWKSGQSTADRGISPAMCDGLCRRSLTFKDGPCRNITRHRLWGRAPTMGMFMKTLRMTVLGFSLFVALPSPRLSANQPCSSMGTRRSP
jgi:hypothetical protein